MLNPMGNFLTSVSRMAETNLAGVFRLFHPWLRKKKCILVPERENPLSKMKKGSMRAHPTTSTGISGLTHDSELLSSCLHQSFITVFSYIGSMAIGIISGQLIHQWCENTCHLIRSYLMLKSNCFR